MNEATVRALIRRFAQAVGITDGDKGDISVSSGVWTIDAGAVDNAKLADMATARIKGRTTAGTGDPEDLTGTQATALLDTFTSAAKGLVPASGGGTTNFLRADGTWTAPPTASASDVLSAIAGATAGDVGTYAFARRTTGTADVAFGATLAGSSLRPTSAMQNIDSNNNGAALGAALSGTWQCMGTYDHSIPPSGAGGSSRGVTLWLRVA